MGLQDLFRNVPPGYDWCSRPPRESVRRREKIAVKAGDACTSCGRALLPIARLEESVRVEGAGWWCGWCGMQFREGEG
jgi:hypothetical protein